VQRHYPPCKARRIKTRTAPTDSRRPKHADIISRHRGPRPAICKQARSGVENGQFISSLRNGIPTRNNTSSKFHAYPPYPVILAHRLGHSRSSSDAALNSRMRWTTRCVLCSDCRFLFGGSLVGVRVVSTFSKFKDVSPASARGPIGRRACVVHHVSVRCVCSFYYLES